MKRLILIGMVFCLILAGCSSGASPSPSPSPSPTPSPEVTEPSPTVDPDNPNGYTGINPLTGMPIEDSKVADRPVAVMLNNLKAALPQHGQSQADIIYEIPAEGGITRMLALFQDPSVVGDIGSVRSTRPYYLDVVTGHDAILIHAGGSEQAYSDIKTEGIDALDAVRGNKAADLFWRDQERIKTAGYEHSVFTSGERIARLLPTYDIRLRHEDDYEYRMKFSKDAVPENGTAADKLTIVFSSYKTGVFTYDSASGLYLASEYGAPYVDGNSDEQVAVKNVFVLRADIALIPGDTAGRLTVDLVGSGTGYFACGGKSVEIKWSKASDNDPFVYTLKNGGELVLGKGTSYVNIVPGNAKVTIE
ncbi:DUF3048 domain-containing protein [Papillibacter cinnamivorans]|uniref:DUF3048 domain-containing protein n=1 Tax=Papillibacter cinnamivorans DSM 12816 TaxID=1122930 RepID=A0A1W1YMV6_9FIRM|nr:DUF3048 domain-containing protein [Papillibacter cinnamivorans]SMC37517.1 Protein of unknown function [Papillibacter cinnamivorans DSM 12816]